MNKVHPLNSITPAAIDDNYDNDSNASSSLNSHRSLELSDEQKDQRDDASLAKKSVFIAHRNELRDKILKEVMETVMPDAGTVIILIFGQLFLSSVIHVHSGAYDTDGMLKNKSKGTGSKFVRFCKFIGT